VISPTGVFAMLVLQVLRLSLWLALMISSTSGDVCDPIEPILGPEY
jgi:hypothetical protein